MPMDHIEMVVTCVTKVFKFIGQHKSESLCGLDYCMLNISSSGENHKAIDSICN